MDIDMHGLVSGVRGDETDFNTLHNMLLKEGIVDGEFQCGTNESLISPMEYEGKTYIQYIDGVPATEKLTNVKSGDKTIWGGFYGNDGTNFIIVNNGGSWVKGKITFKVIEN
jgi:hypothetical protein